MRHLRALRAVMLVCLCVSLRLTAQTTAATTVAVTTLSGAVLDPSGAAIPKATLHLHSAGLDRDATSDGTGHFSVGVPPATYDLTVLSPPSVLLGNSTKQDLICNAVSNGAITVLATGVCISQSR